MRLYRPKSCATMSSSPKNMYGKELYDWAKRVRRAYLHFNVNQEIHSYIWVMTKEEAESLELTTGEFLGIKVKYEPDK